MRYLPPPPDERAEPPGRSVNSTRSRSGTARSRGRTSRAKGPASVAKPRFGQLPPLSAEPRQYDLDDSVRVLEGCDLAHHFVQIGDGRRQSEVAGEQVRRPIRPEA